MNMQTERTHPSSSRLGFGNARATGAGGYRLPQRLVDGSRRFETDLGAGLTVLRGSPFEVSAPQRL